MLPVWSTLIPKRLFIVKLKNPPNLHHRKISQSEIQPKPNPSKQREGRKKYLLLKRTPNQCPWNLHKRLPISVWGILGERRLVKRWGKLGAQVKTLPPDTTAKLKLSSEITRLSASLTPPLQVRKDKCYRFWGIILNLPQKRSSTIISWIMLPLTSWTKWSMTLKNG